MLFLFFTLKNNPSRFHGKLWNSTEPIHLHDECENPHTIWASDHHDHWNLADATKLYGFWSLTYWHTKLFFFLFMIFIKSVTLHLRFCCLSYFLSIFTNFCLSILLSLLFCVCLSFFPISDTLLHFVRLSFLFFIRPSLLPSVLLSVCLFFLQTVWIYFRPSVYRDKQKEWDGDNICSTLKNKLEHPNSSFQYSV